MQQDVSAFHAVQGDVERKLVGALTKEIDNEALHQLGAGTKYRSAGVYTRDADHSVPLTFNPVADEITLTGGSCVLGTGMIHPTYTSNISDTLNNITNYDDRSTATTMNLSQLL